MHASRKNVRRIAALAGSCTATLALAGVAQADKEKIQLTAAGQAAAKAVVLTRNDVAVLPGLKALKGVKGLKGLKGGAVKPDLTPPTGCPGFEPKQSDLVLHGAASTRWTSSGIQIESEAQVLKSQAMIALDWKRTVTNPRVLPCLRTILHKGLPANAKLVSFRRVTLPRLAPYASGFRALIDVQTEGSTVRVLSDILAVGKGRTEITLAITAAAAEASAVRTLELRWLRSMVSRTT
jgi:hypothetical protein